LGFPCCLKRSPCPYRGPSDLADALRRKIDDIRGEGGGLRDIDAGLAAELFLWLLSAVAHRHQNVTQAGQDFSAMCRFFLNGLTASTGSQESHSARRRSSARV